MLIMLVTMTRQIVEIEHQSKIVHICLHTHNPFSQQTTTKGTFFS